MSKTTATCTIDRTPYTARDVRDLNKVAKLLAKYGAVSVERVAKLAKMSERSASWCLFHVGAVWTPAELFVWSGS